MKKEQRLPIGWVAVLLLGTATVGASIAAEAPGGYEKPTPRKASAILPPEILSGPNHRVRDAVLSDGFLDIFTIDTKWGPLEAVSRAQLKQYVAELDAVARLARLQGSDEFAAGIADAAGGVASGLTSLVSDPAGSMSGAVTGVGSVFGRAREALASEGAKGAQEDSAIANLVGFSKTKREYAYAFGVDVYSRNPVLQEHLDAVAKTAFAGNITTKLALAAVPGGAGAAITGSGTTHVLDEAFRDLPPLELRKRNREKLKAMGVSDDVADLYVKNGTLTPREQTLIVEALAGMTGTADRAAFIKHAVSTDNADMAYFRYRQAQMYAAYHRQIAPLARFITVGEVAVGQQQDGVIVFCAPLDRLFWTGNIGAFAKLFESELARIPGAKGKELWLGGTLSPSAGKALGAIGWTVKEGAEDKLLPVTG